MKKFLLWIEQKAIPAVEKWWRPVAVVIGLILAVLIGKKIYGTIVHAIVGKVTYGTPFTPVAGDPTHVAIATPAGPKLVKLPDGVTADKVTSLAYAPGYIAKVEVKNVTTQRR
jgi:Na+-translocating ferredoxin:NAD+ oxidoreductase RnfD subunit